MNQVRWGGNYQHLKNWFLPTGNSLVGIHFSWQPNMVKWKPKKWSCWSKACELKKKKTEPRENCKHKKCILKWSCNIDLTETTDCMSNDLAHCS